MVDLKGTGAPDSSIQASIGDIYTDESTGKKYKCTFAIRIGGGSAFDTTWAEMKNFVKTNQKKQEAVTDVKKEVVEETKEKPTEGTSDKSEQQKPKNYTNYSKTKSKQTTK